MRLKKYQCLYLWLTMKHFRSALSDAFFFYIQGSEVMSGLEIFVWAIIGGAIVAGISVIAGYSIKEIPSTKQISRDFLIGAAFTGFAYPLIPDTFDTMKTAATSTASSFDLKSALSSASTATSGFDPGVKVGPANF